MPLASANVSSGQTIPSGDPSAAASAAEACGGTEAVECGAVECGRVECGADTPVRALPSPGTVAGAAPCGATTRGPGSNEASPRPSARRFSTFSLSLSADPTADPAVAVVIV